MTNRTKKIIAFFTIVSGFFMALLDSTIVNVSLPTMIKHFGTNMETISWVVNGYNLAFAVLLLTASRLADQFGRKKIFILGIILFTVTSLLAGLSQSAEQLIFFRVLQGLSGALIVPVSMPLILELFPASMSGTAIGIWGGVAGVASASGPTLGGIITQFFDWQWIFFVNIPLGLIAALFSVAMIKESFDPKASKRVDWVGMGTLSMGMFCLVLALIQANTKGWTSPYILTLFTIAVTTLIAFVITEIKVKEPMMPLWLLKNRFFTSSMLTLFILGSGLMCGVFFLSFFLTEVMEMSQLRAGLIVTAVPLSAMIFSGISGPLSDKFGSKWFAFTGMTAMCLSIFLFSQLTYTSSIKDILWRLALAGASMGFALPPVVSASIRATPKDKIGIASGVGNVARTLGAVVGVALLVTVVTHFAKSEVTTGKESAIALISSDQVLSEDARNTLTTRLRTAEFSHDSRLPTEQDIIVKFNERKTVAVQKAPSMMKGAIGYVYDKQIAHVSILYPQVKDIFKMRMTKAFSKTFVLTSIFLSIGILFSLFVEKRRVL